MQADPSAASWKTWISELLTWEGRPIVRPWLERAMKFVSLRPKDPPAASRAYALVAVAMADAAAAAWHGKYVYNRAPPRVRSRLPGRPTLRIRPSTRRSRAPPPGC